MKIQLLTLLATIVVRIGIPLLAAIQYSAAAADQNSIQELMLDQHKVFRLPIGIENVTTVSFPGPISALDGAALTLDGKTPGKFHVAYKPGNYFFSVRSLGKGGSTNLNVVWNRKTYVLELVDSESPVLSVIFKPETDSDHKLRTNSVSPTRLLGLLDKAKAHPLLKEHHPDSVESVQHSEPKTITDYPDFTVTMAEAFRFNEEDTLIFRVVFQNKTDREIGYIPDGFALRVGDRFYDQSISDATGVIPPNAQSEGWFAVTGTPSGGRNELSLKNEFTVLVAQASSPDVSSK